MKNGSKVWYCKRLPSDDGYETFEKPKEIVLELHHFTVQPINGYDNIVEFGENVGKTWNCIAQPYDEWFGEIKEGDRFYVDGVEPSSLLVEPEDGWGFDANARVTSVRPQNIAIRIILQKIE